MEDDYEIQINQDESDDQDNYDTEINTESSRKDFKNSYNKSFE